MNVWIDLDNSPHVPFFVPIIGELERRGHSVTLTARQAFQVCQLASLFGLKYKRVGRHYGKHTALKIYGACVRALQLLPSTLGAGFHLALSHGSRSQLIAATVRRIPSLVIFDYEFAHRLFIESTWVMVPEVIPDAALHLGKERVLRYPGIKEDVYVPTFTPDPSIRKQLGLDSETVLVTVRPPADEAHYRSRESDTLFNATIDFLAEAPGTTVVLLPRTDNQHIEVRRRWPELFSSRKLVVPERAVDGLNLIWHSDLVVSGGGTMNREAAALRVPVYSIFRGKIGAVDRYLAEQGRLVLIESERDVRQKILLSRRQIPPGVCAGNTAALSAIINNILDVCGRRHNGNGGNSSRKG